MLQSSLSRTCRSGGMPNQQERERTPSAFAKINHDHYFTYCNRDLSFIERSQLVDKVDKLKTTPVGRVWFFTFCIFRNLMDVPIRFL